MTPEYDRALLEELYRLRIECARDLERRAERADFKQTYRNLAEKRFQGRGFERSKCSVKNKRVERRAVGSINISN